MFYPRSGGVSGSSISVGVCDHMGLSPLTPPFFCLRVAGRNGAIFCGAWAQEAAARRFVVYGGGAI